jgi:hypothetical protein
VHVSISPSGKPRIRGVEPTHGQLAALARASWKRAKALAAPPHDDDAARAAIAAALKFAADATSQHAFAQRAFDDFLKSGRVLFPSTDRFTARLHWTIWLMAQRLFEFSTYDRARRCKRACRLPNACPAADDPKHKACSRILVFPYLHLTSDASNAYSGWNLHKAARAINRGLSKADVVRQNGNPYRLNEPAVRQAIARFSERH